MTAEYIILTPGGAAIAGVIFLGALYFVIKTAVKRAILEAEDAPDKR